MHLFVRAHVFSALIVSRGSVGSLCVVPDRDAQCRSDYCIFRKRTRFKSYVQ